MTSYTQQQREYLTKRPANVIQYMTVEFYHPDFGYIRLVQNQYTDKVFEGETYQAVSMEVPGVTNQTTDSTRAGTIQFGRIGLQTRQKLLMITPLGAIRYPIRVIIRQYEQGIETPIYQRTLYANKNGVVIGAESVSVQLSVSNPSKLTNEGAFYDPAIFKGLQVL